MSDFIQWKLHGIFRRGDLHLANSAPREDKTYRRSGQWWQVCQEVSPCPLFKLAESNKALFCQPWVVSLQISAHEETSKTKYPWRDGLGLFLHWPLFHAAIRKHKIRVSATPEYTALDAQEQVPLLLTGTEQLSKGWTQALHFQRCLWTGNTCYLLVLRDSPLQHSFGQSKKEEIHRC